MPRGIRNTNSDNVRNIRNGSRIEDHAEQADRAPMHAMVPSSMRTRERIFRGTKWPTCQLRILGMPSVHVNWKTNIAKNLQD
jgi:hypothetical protein